MIETTIPTQALPSHMKDLIHESRLREMIHDEVPPEDRSGRAPLVLIAEALAKRPPGDDIRTRWEWAAAQLVHEVENYSDTQTRRLVRFLYAAKLASREIKDEVKKSLRTSCRGRNDLRKRAELFRWLVTTGERLLPKELNDETEIKARHLWLWIDAMAAADWETAKKEINTAMKRQKRSQDLLARLPYFWREYNLTQDDLGRWIAVLPKPEGMKLTAWSERRDLSRPRVTAPVLDEKMEVAAAPGIDLKAAEFVRIAIVAESQEVLLTPARKYTK